jgi:hypothetical protein
VQVDLGPHAHEVPAHHLVLLHVQAGQVAVDVAVDGVLEVALLELLVLGVDAAGIGGVLGDVLVQVGALVLVRDEEHGDEFAVDVLG